PPAEAATTSGTGLASMRFRCPAALAASGGWARCLVAACGDSVSGPTAVLPFQRATMSTAQQAAVSYLARYSGRTHSLYAYQLGQWLAWCETNALEPLVGIQRAHVELYIRGI